MPAILSQTVQSQSILGSDLAALPQGQVLALILAEMRVQSVLLAQLVNGQTSDEQLDDLRADALYEPKILNLTTIT